jgi:hypothetical protein
MLTLAGSPTSVRSVISRLIQLTLKMLFIVEKFGTPHVERPFQCPNKKCSRLFIALYYRRQIGDNTFYFHSCVPVEMKDIKQSETISKISPDFCAIYGEAHKAEQHGLSLVAGPGYRKALEFLVKDYIIGQLKEPDPAKVAATKTLVVKSQLAACINNHIRSDQIKEIAKRATWLGNDETHYVRKWEDKDLKDLKKLISLTLHWIEMETITAEVITNMPEGKP